MNSFYRAISLAAIFWTTVSMSAYTPHETGSRTTASGAKAKEGYTCAANFVPLGSVIIYEGHKYVVQDRMNPKYNRHVDIFMESHNKALQFGRKKARVQVITQGDMKAMHPDEKRTNTQSDKKTRPHPPTEDNHRTNTSVTAQQPHTTQSPPASNSSQGAQSRHHTPAFPSVVQKPQPKP